ncbi:MAG TPA: chromate resistance protein ChrB domain-containing protein [Candidatus Polarisedimenticolia bacterium]|nr:chromate resistance protein ChrB domain-containing protein [Candidatus Polarisedimenticolia bacterium]
MSEESGGRWSMLIHQIPPKPNYLRVKIWRRLQRLGAVAIKNSVYVLPKSEQAREDFEWVLREIVEGGGDGSICEARFVEGLSDQQVESLFHEAREADYAQIAEETRRLAGRLPSGAKWSAETKAQVDAELTRLKRRLAEVVSIDFLGASGREKTNGLLTGLEGRLRSASGGKKQASRSMMSPADFRGRTWVTRKGIHVDRMASAWLIRRFIDNDARFKFVPGKDYRPEPGEVRFDMFEAEFTHEGDRCTFEVLLGRFSLADPGLREIAEIVHDVDLKDGKFGRQDALGFERLVAGIALAHREDKVRLERAGAVLDDLYEYYRRKPEKRRLS